MQNLLLQLSVVLRFKRILSAVENREDIGWYIDSDWPRKNCHCFILWQQMVSSIMISISISKVYVTLKTKPFSWVSSSHTDCLLDTSYNISTIYTIYRIYRNGSTLWTESRLCRSKYIFSGTLEQCCVFILKSTINSFNCLDFNYWLLVLVTFQWNERHCCVHIMGTYRF